MQLNQLLFQSRDFHQFANLMGASNLRFIDSQVEHIHKSSDVDELISEVLDSAETVVKFDRQIT